MKEKLSAEGEEKLAQAAAREEAVGSRMLGVRGLAAAAEPFLVAPGTGVENEACVRAVLEYLAPSYNQQEKKKKEVPPQAAAESRGVGPGEGAAREQAAGQRDADGWCSSDRRWA